MMPFRHPSPILSPEQKEWLWGVTWWGKSLSYPLECLQPKEWGGLLSRVRLGPQGSADAALASVPSTCSLEQQMLLVSQWQLRRSKVWVFPPAEMFAIVPWDPLSPLWNIWSTMGQARHWVLSATSPLSRTWVSGSSGWQPLPLISSTVPYPAKCSFFRKPQNTFLASVLCTLPR